MDVFKAIHTVAVPFLVALCTCETVRPISIVFFRYFPTIPMASKSISVTAKVIPPSSQSSTDPSNAQFATLLAAIKQSETRLDQKLVAFRSDLKEEAATKAANRVRRDKPYAYKKKAHEEQATFNEKVQEAVREAHEALETATDSPAVQRAKTALQQGSTLLSERQKLIKIADRSANGWGVVVEYTADELADDSDDEKRLEKAEKAAERKAGLKRERDSHLSKNPPRSPTARRVSLFPSRMGILQHHTPAVQTLQQSGASGRRLGGPATQRAVGPCFACGEMGHLRSYCPRTSQDKKWYPSHGMTVQVCGNVKCCVVRKMLWEMWVIVVTWAWEWPVMSVIRDQA